MSNENLPAIVDEWNDDTDSNGARVIQGTIIKCIDGHWFDRDKTPIAAGAQFLVLSTTQIIQRWEGQRPVETIIKVPGEPLPNIDVLNAKVPRDQWELGFDGTPRPPWQHQHVVYLLDPVSCARFTFASGTIGASIAVADLRDAVKWQRAMRGANVYPLVTLATKAMKTRFGQKLRPEFKIVGWRILGNESPLAQQIEAKPAEIGKPVEPVSLKDELKDEIRL